MMTRDTRCADGRFIHPVCEPAVMLGNGTIALELARQWQPIDSMFIPVGGGGLLSGIALGLRALGLRPRIVACEVETAAPLESSRRAGKAVAIQRQPSFVDGIGGGSVLDEMWPLLNRLVDEVVVVSLAEVKAAMRALARESHLVSEGAGAASVAAAMRSGAATGNSVAVISGGNIDPQVFAEIITEQA